MSYYNRNINYRENRMIKLIDEQLKEHLYKYLGNKRFHFIL